MTKIKFSGIVLIIEFFVLSGIVVFPQSLEAGRYKYPYLYGDHHRHYYFHSPQEEKSPYENLEVKPSGTIQIMVKPANAQVFVDGYELKQEGGSFCSIGLLTGSHVVEARAEGYKHYSQEVEIEKGKKEVLLINLTR